MDAGCDCGADEPGTCLGCRCERALLAERARAQRAEYERDCAYREGQHQAREAESRETAAVRERDEARAEAARLAGRLYSLEDEA